MNFPDLTNDAGDALAVIDVPIGATTASLTLASGADRVIVGIAAAGTDAWADDALDVSAFALAIYADRSGTADVLLAGSPSPIDDAVPMDDGAVVTATFDGTRWRLAVDGTDAGPATDYTEAPPCRLLIGIRDVATITGITLDGGDGTYAETFGLPAPGPVTQAGLRREMRDTVYAEIQEFADARGLDLLRPNEALETDESRVERGQPQRTAYLRVSVLPTRPDVRGIKNGWALHQWLIQTDLFVRDGVGDDAAADHADDMAALLPMGRTLFGPTRTFQVIDAPDVSTIDALAGWAMTAVTIPVQALE